MRPNYYQNSGDKAEMTNTQELDRAIEAQRQKAQAEKAYTATGRTDDNPWLGATEQLRQLEAERSTIEAAKYGETLMAAYKEVQSINSHLAKLAQTHTEAVQALKDAAFHPAVHRYRQAPQVAREYGVGHMWDVVKDFIASDKPWSKAPIQASALKAPELPDGLKFSEQDRAAILAFREAQTTVGRLEQEVQSAESRRNAILQNHPALQSLTI
jgi:hypothetical protein